MASRRDNPAIRMAKLEAELDAERKRSAELDQAFRKQLDENRTLIIENATLKAELRHLNDDLRQLNETTVPGLQRSLKEVKEELSQERAKLLTHLRNEARSARNRETNALLATSEMRNPSQAWSQEAAADDAPPTARNVVKRELVERENDRPDVDNSAAEGPLANAENLVDAINANADECLSPDGRPRGTTKLLSITIAAPGASPLPIRRRIQRKTQSSEQPKSPSTQRTHGTQKRHQCAQCGKAFRQSDKLRIHKRIHTGEKPFKCGQCDKAFSLSSDLRRHELVHIGEKPFECTQCGKAFSQSGNLRIHKRTRTGEKPFTCTQCGKAFRQSDKLRIHERIHTGEKPFKCRHCDKAFSRSDKLRIHERIHTGEKPFKCGQCDKAFSLSSDLRRHELVHIGEKPFECTQCDKAFSQSGNLHRHVRTHTGERPFKCMDCGKAFRQTFGHLAITRAHPHRLEAVHVRTLWERVRAPPQPSQASVSKVASKTAIPASYASQA